MSESMKGEQQKGRRRRVFQGKERKNGHFFKLTNWSIRIHGDI